MTNRIRTTNVQVTRLSAVEAEVVVNVQAETVTASTELRGKLVGPRCAGASTVEVAYPMRALPRDPALPANTVTARVIVPEPNLWSQETPFYYDATVELWHDGRRCDTTVVTVGLKLGAESTRNA